LFPDRSEKCLTKIHQQGDPWKPATGEQKAVVTGNPIVPQPAFISDKFGDECSPSGLVGKYAPISDAMQKERRKRTVFSMHSQRLRELFAADHFAYNDPLTVEKKLKNWCSLRIPGMPQEQVVSIASKTVPRGYKMTADPLCQ
jgi:hypothetical protein